MFIAVAEACDVGDFPFWDRCSLQARVEKAPKKTSKNCFFLEKSSDGVLQAMSVSRSCRKLPRGAFLSGRCLGDRSKAANCVRGLVFEREYPRREHTPTGFSGRDEEAMLR